LPTLMRESRFSLEDYWRFVNEANADNEDWVPYSTPEAVRVFVFSDPLYDAEKHWVEVAEDRLAADLTVKLQSTRPPEALVELNIAPESRGKGFGEALLKKALESLGDHPCSVRVILSPGNREIASFAKKLGFEAQTMIDLERSLGAIREPQLPEGYRIASAGKHQLHEVLNLWHMIFGTTRRLEELQIMTEQGETLTDVAVAFREDEAVGFSVAQIAPGMNPTEGWIAQLGVKREHRHRGLGKALLLTSLHWLRRQGCSTATINVMADNQPALELYRKLGFRVRRVKEKHLLRRRNPP